MPEQEEKSPQYENRNFASIIVLVLMGILQMALLGNFNVEKKIHDIYFSDSVFYTTTTARNGRVSAIVYSKDKRAAIVDYKTVYEKDKIHIVHEGKFMCDVEVVKIYRDKVEFKNEDGESWIQKVEAARE